MSDSLQGIRKSAILLLSLDEQQANDILLRLDPDAIEPVRREMAALRRVSESDRQAVLDECARELAERNRFESAGQIPAPQETYSLDRYSADDLFGVLHDEHPQCIAAVLSLLPVQQSVGCLGRFPIGIQIDLIRRIATLGPIQPDVLHDVLDSIETRLCQNLRRREEKVLLAKVLDDAGESPAAGNSEPDIGGIVFEDLLALDDSELRMVLEEVDPDGLALALGAASRNLHRRIVRSLPDRAAKKLKTAQDSLGPVHLNDVESAQADIVRILHRLEAVGDVKLQLARRRT